MKLVHTTVNLGINIKVAVCDPVFRDGALVLFFPETCEPWHSGYFRGVCISGWLAGWLAGKKAGRRACNLVRGIHPLFQTPAAVPVLRVSWAWLAQAVIGGMCFPTSVIVYELKERVVHVFLWLSFVRLSLQLYTVSLPRSTTEGMIQTDKIDSNEPGMKSSSLSFPSSSSCVRTIYCLSSLKSRML